MWILMPMVALAAGAPDPVLESSATLMQRAMSLVGLGAMVGLAWLISERRKDIKWRPVLWGVGLQLALGLVILSPFISDLFYRWVDGGVNRLLSFSNQGAEFVFGSFIPHAMVTGSVEGAPTMVQGISPPLMTMAFYVLPTIIFFSSLMSVLYHIGIMQKVVHFIAWVMMRTLGTSGAESLSAAGNIFVGQTEAPLLVKPFVATMTRSELMAVMTGGFATVAGGVMGAYVSFLAPIPGVREGIPNIAGHLVMASILSAPAALACAKIVVPETADPETSGTLEINVEKSASNLMEAAALGAKQGMELALNVAAMLIAIVGLVAGIDWIVGLVPVAFCGNAPTFAATCAAGVTPEPLSLSLILGWLFAPVAFLMGIQWDEVTVVGRLLGEKIVLTELIAYMNLGEIVASGGLSHRSAVICSYALCGFANFASIGIQLGGIGGLAPKRMGELASLGVRAMLAGALAACMTGCIAGLLL
jgi:CNT family concentrative nucleoside transporter